MTDYNFFEGYQVKKKKSSIGVRVVNVVFLVTLIIFAAYIGFNYYTLLKQRSEISDLNSRILEIKSTDDITRIVGKQTLLEELEVVVSNMEEAGYDISHESIINEKLLVDIADAMPSDVALISLEIGSHSISMNGSGMSKPAIAELEYNLRNVSDFEDVFISSISKVDDRNYSFSIDLTVGGESHEDEQP